MFYLNLLWLVNFKLMWTRFQFELFLSLGLSYTTVVCFFFFSFDHTRKKTNEQRSWTLQCSCLMTWEFTCVEESNWSVEADNGLGVHISGRQCTICLLTVLDKDVLLRTEKGYTFLYTHKRQTPIYIITESLKTSSFFL